MPPTTPLFPTMNATGALTPDQERDDFVRQNFAPIMFSLMAQGASEADAADATQQAMIRVCQQWPHPSPHGFAKVVAKQAFIDMYRKERTADTRHERLCALFDRTPAPAADLKAIFDAEVVDVLTALQELPPKQREVIVHTMDGLSAEEIADLTGQKLTTVRSNLRHARAKLKPLIRDRKE
jgi:RNA polymerase sigma factor (sigma-70 family)